MFVNSDWTDLLRFMESRNVRFILLVSVGYCGHTVCSETRFIERLDLWISTDSEKDAARDVHMQHCDDYRWSLLEVWLTEEWFREGKAMFIKWARIHAARGYCGKSRLEFEEVLQASFTRPPGPLILQSAGWFRANLMAPFIGRRPFVGDFNGNHLFLDSCLYHGTLGYSRAIRWVALFVYGAEIIVR